MKPKLLVTASTFPRWEGDTEPRFVLDLSKALLKYFDVTVLVPAAIGAKDKEVLEGVNVIRYHYFPIHKWETLCYPGAIVPRIKEKRLRIVLVPFLLIALWWKLLRMLHEFDVVHAHWIIPQGIVQSFFSKPYMVTGHGGDVTSLNKGIIKKWKIKCLKKASFVTVVSKALEKEIHKLYPVKNIQVISMGCDLSKFGKQFRVENYFAQNEKKIVLFVGRLAEKKGVTYLINAMKNIDALLIIVGDGPLKQQLEEQASQMKNKIKFLGAKTHEELKTIYASSDIFVAPSITAKDGDKEGFGLVFLEAMASGLPVIGSNSGGIPSIVKDGENGFLVEEKDVKDLQEKIEILIRNPDLYDRFSYNAIATAKGYDYQIIGRRYADMLNKMRKLKNAE